MQVGVILAKVLLAVLQEAQLAQVRIVLVQRQLNQLNQENQVITVLEIQVVEQIVDNQAAETVAKDPVMNNGMKHVTRRHYFAKEAQAECR